MTELLESLGWADVLLVAGIIAAGVTLRLWWKAILERVS